MLNEERKDSYLPLGVGPVPVRAGLGQADNCRRKQEDGVWVGRASLDGYVQGDIHP